MDTYNPDELWESIAQKLFYYRSISKATGGKNNIRAKGQGPEDAVRELIASIVGGQYRVTQGHVVSADGRKSGQIDIIIVRDVPAATMYKSENELVRLEWVAAVGEVKSSWYNHTEVIESFYRMVSEIDKLQQNILVKNEARFGRFTPATTIMDLSRPITGRMWNNRCYAFLIALGEGRCKIHNLSNDLKVKPIRACDTAALILDEYKGATLSIPVRKSSVGLALGVSADINSSTQNSVSPSVWTTCQEMDKDPKVNCGRMLHRFVADLQLHLGTWYSEYNDPKQYSKSENRLIIIHADKQNDEA